MDDIAQLLRTAVTEEPDHTIDPSALIAVGRRARLRRRAAVAGSTSGVVAAGVAITVALLPSAPGRTDDAASRHTMPASRPASSTTVAPPAKTGITRDSLPGLIERYAGVRLSNVDVGVLPPTHDLDLAASIASAKGQYLNVQVTPAGVESRTPLRCADIQGTGIDGDYYTGECSVTRNDDGGYLVLRSGRTSNGKYAITMAFLVTKNGAGIVAEATNQKFVPRTSSKGRKDPVVSHDPPLSAAQLNRLVHALQSQR